MLAVAVGNGKRVGTQGGALDTLHVIDQVEQGRGDVDAVGNDLDRHVLEQIDTLDSTSNLELTHVVESRHRVIEVGSQGIACVPCLLDIGIFGGGVADGGNDALVGDVLAHFDGSRQFGGGGPATHAVKVLDDVAVFYRIGNTDDFRHLCSRLAGIEVRTLHVHAHNRRVGPAHHLVTRLAGAFHHVDGRR